MTKTDKTPNSAVVNINGTKWVVYKDPSEDKPVVMLFGDDYNTFIPCDPPPFQGNECVHGYTEECISGQIWCLFNPE